MKYILYTKFGRVYQEFNLFGKLVIRYSIWGVEVWLQTLFKNIIKEVFEGKKQ